jgi:hypothetical protein
VTSPTPLNILSAESYLICFCTFCDMASSCWLLHCPDEILFPIAEYLESCPRDVGAFACTCIRLLEVADPCCYRRLLIRSKDQVKCLSRAVQRKPQRASFIRELTLVPTVEHATNIIDGLCSVLEIMHLVRHLVVEIPFHNICPSTVACLNLKYRFAFEDLFEADSLVSCVAKPRALQTLRSCEYFSSSC